MIRDLLINKTDSEQAQIKSQEVAKLDCTGQYTQGETTVEIQSLVPINIGDSHGVEVLAKAWKSGKQLGFGKDGSVEIERIRIFNPPILVRDDNGVIERVIPATETTPQRTYKLREDPIEAIRQRLALVVKIVGKDGTNIIKGKIGNTVTTFNPAAGANSPVDGKNKGNNATYATVHDAANGDGDAPTATVDTLVGQNLTGGSYFIYRGVTCFNTASIPDTDTIDAAVLTYFPNGTSDVTGGSFTANLYTITLASTANLVAGDYNKTNFGTTLLGSFLSSVTDTDGQSYDITLNADGRAAISKTGVTQLAWRSSKDTPDPGTAPTGAEYKQIYFADQAGTASDPLLTVTHSASTKLKDTIRSPGIVPRKR